MKIALSGAQSVGKTTILNNFEKDIKFKDFKFIKEVVRSLHKKYGIKINEYGNNETQLLITSVHYINSFKNNLITDRCLLDCFIYTSILYKDNKIDVWVYDYVKKIAFENCKFFDYIFYFPPEFEIVDDNFRSLNKNFQEKTHQEFQKYIPLFPNIHIITGTIEERINKIKKIIGV